MAGCMEKATLLQEEKMLFEWIKQGFESGDDLIKQEAQKLAANVMQSKHKTYEEHVLESLDLSD